MVRNPQHPYSYIIIININRNVIVIVNNIVHTAHVKMHCRHTRETEKLWWYFWAVVVFNNTYDWVLTRQINSKMRKSQYQILCPVSHLSSIDQIIFVSHVFFFFYLLSEPCTYYNIILWYFGIHNVSRNRIQPWPEENLRMEEKGFN